jgi:hypothetical protein
MDNTKTQFVRDEVSVRVQSNISVEEELNPESSKQFNFFFFCSACERSQREHPFIKLSSFHFSISTNHGLVL